MSIIYHVGPKNTQLHQLSQLVCLVLIPVTHIILPNLNNISEG